MLNYYDIGRFKASLFLIGEIDLPRYDYRCDSCNHEFELRQSFDSEPVADCTECNSTATRQFHVVPVVFKGSGWYVNDYGSKSSSMGKSSDNADSNSSDNKKSSKEKSNESKTSTDSSKNSSDSKSQKNSSSDKPSISSKSD